MNVFLIANGQIMSEKNQLLRSYFSVVNIISIYSQLYYNSLSVETGLEKRDNVFSCLAISSLSVHKECC